MSTMEPDEGAQSDDQKADAPRWDEVQEPGREDAPRWDEVDTSDRADAPRWDEVQEVGSDDAGSDDPDASTDS
jgi:hypothetical protein